MYYMFGFLLLAFVVLLVVCAQTSVLLCYFHLCAEDYRWWWRSFFSTGPSQLCPPSPPSSLSLSLSFSRNHSTLSLPSFPSTTLSTRLLSLEASLISSTLDIHLSWSSSSGY